MNSLWPLSTDFNERGEFSLQKVSWTLPDTCENEFSGLINERMPLVLCTNLRWLWTQKTASAIARDQVSINLVFFVRRT